MLIVTGTISLDPADHDAALAVAEPALEATAAEEGNITYEFWAHPSERGRFRVYEEWVDQEALDTHFATPYMAEFMTRMGDLGISSIEVIRHTVTDSAQLM